MCSGHRVKLSHGVNLAHRLVEAQAEDLDKEVNGVAGQVALWPLFSNPLFPFQEFGTQATNVCNNSLTIWGKDSILHLEDGRMAHLAFFLLLTLVSAAFAEVEIQAEGAHGWAERFPTWRIENRWTRLVWGRKPVTGYHVFALLFLLGILHFPFCGGGANWSWPLERRVVAFMILFWVLEDFLWFVMNPAFGLKRFKQTEIWWHAKGWLWFMPSGYWIGLPLGLILYVLSNP